MRNAWIICRKELRSYFVSPIAYAVIALFGLIFGYVFFGELRRFMNYMFRSQMMGGAQPMDVNLPIRGMLEFAGTLALFLVPLIAMRLVAEEKRSGTIELLFTSPISDFSIVLGKWLGAMFLYLAVLAMSALNIALLFAWGKPDWKPVLVAYLGLLLQGGCILALGTLVSAFTSSQIVAGGAAFFLSLAFYLINLSTEYDSSVWSKVLNYLSLIPHMENFGRGVLSLKDVVFYLSFIFFALFLTLRQFESVRWRS
jgi:ABC-2 type transport system permease protein